MDLTEDDIYTLEALRLDRYRERCIKMLPDSYLLVLSVDNSLIVDCLDKADTEPLAEHLAELRWAAWCIVGATQLWIAAEGQAIVVANTRPELDFQDCKDTLRNNDPGEFVMVATIEATAETSNVDSPETSNTMPVGVPTLQSINILAASLGIDTGFIVRQINAQGGLAGWDADTQSYKTTEQHWQKFVSWYQGHLASLLNGQTATIEPATIAPEQNGKAITPRKPQQPRRQATAAKTTRKSAATPKPPKTDAGESSPRFKEFTRATGYEKTIGNFLTAQGWDDTKRAETLEAIAVLPDTATDTSAFSERCMVKLLSKYAKGDRQNARIKFINAAKKITGKAA